ncbi:MAG TPA: hypothetical protein VHQ92_11080 [Pseudolabrys sp.]|jgi:hypothetical protein|nr:hypothetical protein [Pseudolabrys sp.]
MADMNFFTDFETLWGSAGTIEPVTQDQYKLGWAYIGALPPAVEQFNKLQQLSDEKVKWLYTQIKTFALAHGIPLTALTSDAIGLAIAQVLTAYAPLSALAPYAPLASPIFSGDPRAPTPATADNDTSIATTAFVKAVVTALNLTQYAPINSPAFTGNPTVPLAARYDDDYSAANTAFVNRARASVAGAISFDESTPNPSLTAAHSGFAVFLTGTTNALFLPPLSDVAEGTGFWIKAESPNFWTLAAAGVDGAAIAYNWGAYASLGPLSTDGFVYVVKGWGRWRTYGTSVGNRVAGSGNTWWKLDPSGVITQWGEFTGSGIDSQIWFPLAFPRNLWNIQVTMKERSGGTYDMTPIVTQAGRTLAGAIVGSIGYDAGTFGYQWFAIGN